MKELKFLSGGRKNTSIECKYQMTLLTLKGRTIFGVTWTEGAQLCPHTVSLPEPAHFGAALHYPPLSH